MLEKIASLDHGVHAHFHFTIRQHPEFAPVMQVANLLGSYVATLAIAALAVVLWLARGQARAALVTLAGFLGSFGTIESIRTFVARERPDDAADWLVLDPLAKLLGLNQSVGSFPAPSVFLFTLAMLLLLFALIPQDASRRTQVLMTIAAAILIVWVTFSQLMLSMHYLTDVVPALAASICVACLLRSFLGVAAAE